MISPSDRSVHIDNLINGNGAAFEGQTDDENRPYGYECPKGIHPIHEVIPWSFGQGLANSGRCPAPCDDVGASGERDRCSYCGGPHAHWVCNRPDLDVAEEASKQQRRRFVSVSEFAAALPLQGALIAPNILGQGTIAGVIGPPKIGKSLLATAWALCVEFGIEWQERTVKQGAAFYCLNEVDRHFPVRVQAFMACHQLTGECGLKVNRAPIALMDRGEVVQLIEDELRPAKAALVVIDTLQKTLALSDGEENSAKDQGRLIANCERIREATGATVVILHHPTKAGTGARGSGALEGAVDHLMIATATKAATPGCKGMRLESRYDRNGPGFDPIDLELRTIQLEDGKTSCVLYPGSEPIREVAPLTPAAEKMLAVLGTKAGGMRWAEWMQATGLADSTFKSGWKVLSDKHLIDKANGKWILV